MSNTVKVRITDSCVICPKGGKKINAKANDVLDLSVEDAIDVVGAGRGQPLTGLPKTLKGEKSDK